MASERGSQTGEEKEPRPSPKVPRPPGLPASPSTLSVPLEQAAQPSVCRSVMFLCACNICLHCLQAGSSMRGSGSVLFPRCTARGQRVATE